MTTKPVLLLADNDQDYRDLAKEFLESQGGYEVITAENPDEARRLLKKRILSGAILDWRLKDDLDPCDDSGIRIVNELRKDFLTPIILQTKFPTFDKAVSVLRLKIKVKDILNKEEGFKILLERIRSSCIHPEIFINYSRTNKIKARRAYQNLQKAGFEPWMDEEDIHNSDWWKKIIQKIHNCDIFLACISHDWLQKYTRPADEEENYLQREVREAFNMIEWSHRSRDFFIPLFLDDVDKKGKEYPDELKPFEYYYYKPDGFLKLVNAIRYRTFLSNEN